MAFFPARYARTRLRQPTFLHQALSLVQDAATRTALLEAIDFDAPDTRRTLGYDRGDGLIQADLAHIHPLSTIAGLGDEDLFTQALARAHATSTRPIALGARRQIREMSDWVDSGVLDTVSALGTPTMLQQLLQVLRERSRLSRGLRPQAEHGEADPWQAMAKHATPDTSPEAYIKKLQLLDRYERACSRSQQGYTERQQVPPQDGTGRLSVWEKRQRATRHTHALASAAHHGNATLVQALLQMGHAHITPLAVAEALRSGGADVAETMLSHPKGLASMLQLEPTVIEKDRWSRWRDPNTLEAGEVLDLCAALGDCVQQWQQVEPEKVPEGVVDLQLAAADRVLPAVLKLLGRFSAEQLLKAQASQPSLAAPVRSLAPVLERLDEASCIQVDRALSSNHPCAPKTVFATMKALRTLPTLKEWSAWLPEASAPWARHQLHKLRTLTKSETAQYRDSLLANELVKFWEKTPNSWNNKDPIVPEYDEVKTLVHLWPHLPGLHVSVLGVWLDSVAKRVSSSPEHCAELSDRLLECQVAPAKGASRAPRL